MKKRQPVRVGAGAPPQKRPGGSRGPYPSQKSAPAAKRHEEEREPQSLPEAPEEETERARSIALRGSERNGVLGAVEALHFAQSHRLLSEAAIAQAIADPRCEVWGCAHGRPAEGAGRGPLLRELLRFSGCHAPAHASGPVLSESLLSWACGLAEKSAGFDPWEPWPKLGLGAETAPIPDRIEAASPLEGAIQARLFEMAARWARQWRRDRDRAPWVDAVVASVSDLAGPQREAARPHWSELLRVAESVELRAQANAGRPAENPLGIFAEIDSALVERWWRDALEALGGDFSVLLPRMLAERAAKGMLAIRAKSLATADQAWAWAMSERSASCAPDDARERSALAKWLIIGSRESGPAALDEFWRWAESAASFDPAAKPFGEEKSCVELAILQGAMEQAARWAARPGVEAKAAWAALALLASNGQSSTESRVEELLAACERSALGEAAEDGMDGGASAGDEPARLAAPRRL
jgi:hypothetical protein